MNNLDKSYKKVANLYWDEEYKKNGWKITYNAGSKELTEELAIKEIDLFLTPTKDKIETLKKDAGNPYPTFTNDFDKHPSIQELNIKMDRCLDYGCGSLARYSIALSNYFKEVYGVDIANQAIIDGKKNVAQSNRNNVKLMMCDGLSLRFPDKYFDFAFSNLVLQHIGYKAGTLQITKEIGRCLKVGGAARLEYLPSKHYKGESFFHVAEGNGVSVGELSEVLKEVNCEIVCSTEQDPYLWITMVKK